jgi:hypothetical protein
MVNLTEKYILWLGFIQKVLHGFRLVLSQIEHSTIDGFGSSFLKFDLQILRVF